mmetsp:Transcript_23377/g.52736  ORF Transcript_23377/g.52736 Transcript_23377/m.52736 type:complete len:130 (-) Transcript_23377:39-428(-)
MWHFAMMNDRPRNAAYFRALQRVIFPGQSVVLDIGSGTSALLAMMAARLGARRVYTVEANPVLAAMAAETLARNRLDRRVTALSCSSTDLVLRESLTASEDGRRGCVLEERPTVIVSEVTIFQAIVVAA